MNPHQDVLVVVTDPARYDDAIKQWSRSATVSRQLPPRLALVAPNGDPPDVPGTRWYLREVPGDVLLSLEPQERIFVAGWQDHLPPKKALRQEA
jgi:hypothetical protein